MVGFAVRGQSLGQVKTDHRDRRVVRVGARKRFLQVADGWGVQTAFVEHPAERVGNTRVVGPFPLRAQSQIERAIEILAPVRIEIGEIVLGLDVRRRVLESRLVAPNGAVGGADRAVPGRRTRNR